jgi:hypothetical protein
VRRGGGDRRAPDRSAGWLDTLVAHRPHTISSGGFSNASRYCRSCW